MAEKGLHKCPICKGKGELPRPHDAKKKKFEEKSNIAKGLQKEGYSFREIMFFMGFKSTSTVEYYLNKK